MKGYKQRRYGQYTLKQGKICLPIDVEISSDRTLIQKKARKKPKYKNICIGIQRTWNMKCFVIAVITDATGNGTEGLNYLDTLPGEHSINSL
jgi:hypothetical protein